MPPETPAAAPRDTDAYRYDLPEGRIARAPAEPPDSARLLRVGTSADSEALGDSIFRDIAETFRSGDVLVINETRVVRARLRGAREPGGGEIEVLLLKPADRERYDATARRWQVLMRPAKRMQPGVRVRFGDDTVATVVSIEGDGSRIVEFELGTDFEAFLERHGELPLPPYVGRVAPVAVRERDASAESSRASEDPRAARYQTVFARVPGSVAAPTASLHFTTPVLDAIRARGVTIAPLVLDVGIGTFRPMQGETIDEHVMHGESYEISVATAASVNAAFREGRRVVVAGTTALRALEAAALRQAGNASAGAARGGDATDAVRDRKGEVISPGRDTATLFITPGFRFRVADVLLTNFHLPASTLLVLVSAFAGYERTMRAYAHAIAGGYRFFSFGDAMLVSRATEVS